MSARPAIHKGSPRLKFSFAPAREQSVLGGPPAIEALAQEFGLWEKLRKLRLPDECQGWQVRTLMARLVRLPVTLVTHARCRRGSAASVASDRRSPVADLRECRTGGVCTRAARGAQKGSGKCRDRA